MFTARVYYLSQKNSKREQQHKLTWALGCRSLKVALVNKEFAPLTQNL